jgi:hypothetical protein
LLIGGCHGLGFAQMVYMRYLNRITGWPLAILIAGLVCAVGGQARASVISLADISTEDSMVAFDDSGMQYSGDIGPGTPSSDDGWQCNAPEWLNVLGLLKAPGAARGAGTTSSGSNTNSNGPQHCLTSAPPMPATQLVVLVCSDYEMCVPTAFISSLSPPPRVA